MGFFKINSNGGSTFINDLIKRINSAYTRSTSIFLNDLDYNALDRLGSVSLENRGRPFNDSLDLEEKKSIEKAVAIESFMKLSIPQSTSTDLVNSIDNAVLKAQSLTTSGTIFIEQMTYQQDYSLEKGKSNYLPITLFSFKDDIITKLNKYNYVIPLILYTEIKNTSSDMGIRLEAAVSTAYDFAWMKGDSAEIMKNLNPLSINNQDTISDLQVVSQETFNCFTIDELKDKWIWLKNPNNLDLLFGSDFNYDKEYYNEKGTRNPNNGIILKETQRENPTWKEYSVLSSQLNGVQTISKMCNKTVLLTGYAIKPRDGGKSNEYEDPCSISVTSKLIFLCIQNDKDFYNSIITNPPYDLELEIPSPEENGQPIKIKGKDLQKFVTDRYYTIANASIRPAKLIDKQNCIVFDIWAREAQKDDNSNENDNSNSNEKENKDKNDKLKLLNNNKNDWNKLIKTGLSLYSHSISDNGFNILEKK